MPQITITHDTWLKARLMGSTDLEPSEKVFTPAGHEIWVSSIYPSRNQHYKMVAASPLATEDPNSQITDFYAYEGHVDIGAEAKASKIKLPVPYFSQVDNSSAIHGPGWRQCNLTSCCMAADYLLEGRLRAKAKELGFSEPESYYGQTLAQYGDTTDHAAQTQALADLGISSYFSYTLSENDVLLSLEANCPVVVGLAYKGSGHICAIVGHDPERGVWLVHDPYGTRHGATDSYDIGVGGDFDLYSYATMQKVFWDMGNEAGWGRIVTHINGKPTGLSFNL